MMKRYLTVLFLFCSLISYAKNGLISGTIVDKNTMETLPMATVQLRLAGSGTTVVGGLTDADGNFEFKDLELQAYELNITYVGYTDKNIKITLSKENPSRRFKSIKMGEDEGLLQEVTVVGKRTSLQMDVDKKVFLLNESAHTEGVSASDILKDIPSVDVDAEGSVTLRNSEAVEVRINGKAVGLGDGQGDILEQLPAGSIEKVEVITNPSAKFSAESSAGIINIVMKSNHSLGAFGSVGAGVRVPWKSDLGGSLNANINYGSDKIDVMASAGLFRTSSAGDGFTNRYRYGQDTTFLFQSQENDFTMNSGFLRLSLDYKINPKNVLTLSTMGSLSSRERIDDMRYRSGLVSNELESTKYIYGRHIDSKPERTMYNVSLEYKHKFKKEGQEISTLASLSNTSRNEDARYDQLTFEQFQLSQPVVGSIQNLNKDEYTRLINLQLDYVSPIFERSKLETGLSGSFTKSGSEVESLLKKDAESAFEPIPGQDNDFCFNPSTYAAYVSWGTSFGKLKTNVGLRGELLDIRWEQKLTNEEYHKDPIFNLFPSLFLGYPLSKTLDVQFSYTRRTNTPRSFYFNPYHNVSDSANVSFGNPDLEPEYVNSFELGLIKTFENHTFSASAYHKRTTDVIQSYNWMEGNVMMRTYANMANSQASGIDLVLKDRFGKFLSLTSSVDLYYYKLEGGTFSYVVANEKGSDFREYQLKERNSLGLTFRSSADFSLPHDISAQLAGNYSAPRATAQGKTMASYQLNASVKKPFFQRKLTAALQVRDILNSRKRASESWSEDFWQETEFHRYGRMFMFNLTYSFGNNKNKKKQKSNQQESNTEDFEEF